MVSTNPTTEQINRMSIDELKLLTLKLLVVVDNLSHQNDALNKELEELKID